MITPTTDLTMPAQSQEVEIAPRETEINQAPFVHSLDERASSSSSLV
jgi:hypothetical protein